MLNRVNRRVNAINPAALTGIRDYCIYGIMAFNAQTLVLSQFLSFWKT